MLFSKSSVRINFFYQSYRMKRMPNETSQSKCSFKKKGQTNLSWSTKKGKNEANSVANAIGFCKLYRKLTWEMLCKLEMSGFINEHGSISFEIYICSGVIREMTFLFLIPLNGCHFYFPWQLIKAQRIRNSFEMKKKTHVSQ